MIYDILSSTKAAWAALLLITIAAILYTKFSKKELFQKLFDTASCCSKDITAILFIFSFFGGYSEHFRDFLPFIATCCGLLFLCFTIMSYITKESGQKFQAGFFKFIAIFFLFDMMTTFFF